MRNAVILWQYYVGRFATDTEYFTARRLYDASHVADFFSGANSHRVFKEISSAETGSSEEARNCTRRGAIIAKLRPLLTKANCDPPSSN